MVRNHKNDPIFKYFDTRREFPRINMEIPAMITGRDGKPIKAILYDLSPGGAQIHYQESDGINLFPGKKGSKQDSASLRALLQFHLQSGDSKDEISIHADPVYVRYLDDETLAAGVFFAEEDVEAKSLIKHFLYMQLEMTFYGLDNPVKKDIETSTVDALSDDDELIELPEEKIDATEPVSDISEAGNPRSDMEYLKQELIRMQSTLKVVLETARHIDEKLSLLEQRIRKK